MTATARDTRTPTTLQPADLLTTREAARRYQVSVRTILTWAKKGWIPSGFTPGGHRRYVATALDQAVAEVRARYGR